MDLTGYFVLPSPGYVKFFTGGTSQTYIATDTISGFTVVDVLQTSGQHDYLRSPDRAWVAWQPAGDTSVYLVSPPLAAPPEQMPASSDHVAAASFPTGQGAIPVIRYTRLVDTGLSITVPAGTFDSVVQLRQEFWTIVTTLGVPDTIRDSAYRWYAPGVDEIRREQWRDTATVSTILEFQGGSVNGSNYP